MVVAGRGAGEVTSEPALVACGSSERCVHPVASRSRVTLTATPAPGSSFRGWKGKACVEAPGASCTVLMDRNVKVKALFDLD